ncbi:hypothetical protein CEUSTIGMA_g1482.t1 [Chlamydomonas eustigma]|uniref:Sugar phosphate transporter domain-containing protein n=1 Tax=Chlamydomonas eustigma TaxID=1157962 RepID=A0A250WTS4_9CHLO|nr:hypothetical protein CEUSTIGMA_g1482.t1 [Chlamydomonas eustigma]|eukprot:GAX74032.1 hypothetical protein CEUSTIGMA_g1482.t1 [Chlamydomonas eustigma]
MSGIAIASGGEPLFHMVGFLFCMTATAGRALKSVTQSLLMSDPAEKLDPMSLLLYMSAVCVVMLVPLTVCMEPKALEITIQMSTAKPTFMWWLMGNSLLAYFVNLTNFMVTKFTSPLTQQVLGNAKGVLAAIISVFVFLNPVTTTGVLGYGLTMVGVFLYSQTKRMGGKSTPAQAAPSVTAASSSFGAACTANMPAGDASVVLSIAVSPCRAKHIGCNGDVHPRVEAVGVTSDSRLQTPQTGHRLRVQD